jgi:ABC-type phosphate/phosphonate transport system permease subunit
MALEHSEIQALKKEFFAEADKRYVKIESCSEKQDTVNEKFANDDTRIKLFEQNVKTWEWMLKTIAAGVIGTLLTSILSLIIK